MKNQEKENDVVEPTRRHNFQYNGSDFIYKQSNKTPRRISCPQVEDKQACGRGTGEKGFVTRLWLKVKKGLLWKKHEGEERRNKPSKAY
ncbi:hypothetical protein P8452_76883 [Trifolium repens]|nr:hypothetical protein P8452_76883 [Trifolium repens]